MLAEAWFGRRHHQMHGTRRRESTGRLLDLVMEGPRGAPNR
ncbi:hypothetical protein ACWF94_13070 [Streptomyces sp. NPDC055078]